MAKKIINIVGNIYGRLKVIKHVGVLEGTKQRYWECLCSCGNKVVVMGSSLKDGRTLSCGCYQREVIGKRSAKHRMSGSSIYRTYTLILQRCYNKNNPNYKHYGGRGIKVDTNWLGEGGFERFYRDVGIKPERGYTLDRINNDGGYTKENIRWATKIQQTGNRRLTLFVLYSGKKITLSEFCRERKLIYNTTKDKLKMGKIVEGAVLIFTDPIHKK